MRKKWYRSKTLWVNAVMLLGVVIQQVTGQDLINTEAQAAIVTVVNVGLRLATEEGLE